jgi:hypothetical protein
MCTMTIIIIIIIIIIILGISFMQGIYTYIPEANHVPREGTWCCSYSDVTIHGVHIVSSCVDSIVSLCYHFPKMCAEPNLAVFCSSLT